MLKKTPTSNLKGWAVRWHWNSLLLRGDKDGGEEDFENTFRGRALLTMNCLCLLEPCWKALPV